MSRTFAYCRVSTADQQTKNQIQEIKAAGFDVQSSRVVCENISGSTAAEARPGFIKLLERMESGDVLIVTKLDRLGRNSIDVQQTVQALEAGGVRVHCLALGGVDLTSSAGKMTMGVLAAVAQFERDLIIERTQAGLQRAKSEGRTLGRPSVLDGQQRAEVLARLAAGETVYAVAKAFNTSRQVIMRVRESAIPRDSAAVTA